MMVGASSGYAAASARKGHQRVAKTQRLAALAASPPQEWNETTEGVNK